MADPAETISEVCAALSRDDTVIAAAILNRDHPFEVPSMLGRKYTSFEVLGIWIRDGFIDRYTGQRLIFPPALRLVSDLLPSDVPYHLHGKLTECHILHWTHTSSIDHVIPISRGGSDDVSNLVTTCMAKNSQKANSTLDELGWKLCPEGNMKSWDGLVRWFCEYVDSRVGDKNDPYVNKAYVKRWRNVVRQAMNDEFLMLNSASS